MRCAATKGGSTRRASNIGRGHADVGGRRRHPFIRGRPQIFQGSAVWRGRPVGGTVGNGRRRPTEGAVPRKGRRHEVPKLAAAARRRAMAPPPAAQLLSSILPRRASSLVWSTDSRLASACAHCLPLFGPPPPPLAFSPSLFPLPPSLCFSGLLLEPTPRGMGWQGAGQPAMELELNGGDGEGLVSPCLPASFLVSVPL